MARARLRTSRGAGFEARLTGDAESLPVGAAVAAGILGGFFLLVTTAFGTASLEEGSEAGPGFAIVATLVIGPAMLMISVMVRRLMAPRRHAWLPKVPRSVLVSIALVGLLGAVYIFVAAAPGAPNFHHGSWAEIIPAAAGLWLGLTALRVLDPRLAWGVIPVASVVLVISSSAIMS